MPPRPKHEHSETRARLSEVAQSRSAATGRRGACSRPGRGNVDDGFDLDGFLAQLLVARVATVGPTGPSVRALWYLWEARAFWWLTGGWSRLGQLLERDPRVALVVDTCDLDRGEVLQVTARSRAELHPFEADRARRWGCATSEPTSATGVASKARSSTIPRRASSPSSRRSSAPATSRTDCRASQREPLAGVLPGSWRLPLTAECEVSRKTRPPWTKSRRLACRGWRFSQVTRRGSRAISPLGYCLSSVAGASASTPPGWPRTRRARRRRRRARSLTGPDWIRRSPGEARTGRRGPASSRSTPAAPAPSAGATPAGTVRSPRP
jgi:Pyridoxamine 5'-phosphate oxidase